MDDAIFRTVIAPADVLIDLHGGDMVEALVPFSIYSVSGNDEVDARSVALGRAFGLPYLVASRPQPGGIGGTTAHAAAAAGIPSIIAESGSSGLLTEPETQLMVDGIENALRSLGMLEGEVRRHEPVEIEQFTWLRSPAEGMWYPVGRGRRAGARRAEHRPHRQSLRRHPGRDQRAPRRRGALHHQRPGHAARRADDRRRRDIGE